MFVLWCYFPKILRVMTNTSSMPFQCWYCKREYFLPSVFYHSRNSKIELERVSFKIFWRRFQLRLWSLFHWVGLILKFSMKLCIHVLRWVAFSYVTACCVKFNKYFVIFPFTWFIHPQIIIKFYLSLLMFYLQLKLMLLKLSFFKLSLLLLFFTPRWRVVSGGCICSYVKVNKSRYIALLVFSGSMKKFSAIDCVSLYLFSIIFFNRFCLVEKCRVTPHWLYSLTLTKCMCNKI